VAHTACLVDHAGSRDGGNDICTRGEGGEEKKNGECKNSEHSGIGRRTFYGIKERTCCKECEGKGFGLDTGTPVKK